MQTSASIATKLFSSNAFGSTIAELMFVNTLKWLLHRTS